MKWKLDEKNSFMDGKRRLKLRKKQCSLIKMWKCQWKHKTRENHELKFFVESAFSVGVDQVFITWSPAFRVEMFLQIFNARFEFQTTDGKTSNLIRHKIRADSFSAKKFGWLNITYAGKTTCWRLNLQKCECQASASQMYY